jgi:hypothetical protein
MPRMLIRLLPIAAAAAIVLPAETAHAAAPVVGPFHTIALTAHAGDFVPPSASASTVSFILPGHLQGEELELTGLAGPPVVTLTSPIGATVVPPPSLDGLHVDVRLLRPAAGTWVISLQPGSPAVLALAGATVTYRPSARGAKRPRGTRPNRSSTLRSRRPPSGGRRR